MDDQELRERLDRIERRQIVTERLASLILIGVGLLLLGTGLIRVSEPLLLILVIGLVMALTIRHLNSDVKRSIAKAREFESATKVQKPKF